MFLLIEAQHGIRMYTADFAVIHTVSMNVHALAGHFAITVKHTILRSGQLAQPMGHQSFVRHVGTSTMFFGTIATKDPCSDAVLPSPPDPLRQIHSTTISAYRVSNHSHVPRTLSLVDRGANGGVAGEDVRPIYLNDRCLLYTSPSPRDS